MVRPAFALMACSTIALVAVARCRPTGVLSPAADLEGIDEALDNLAGAGEHSSQGGGLKPRTSRDPPLAATTSSS